MKARILIISAMVLIFAFISGCEEESSNQKGVLNLSLTDAPIDQPSVTGVYVTIQGLEYHKQDNSWATFEEYESQKFNLLELTDGVTTLLGNFELSAGQYNQLRFTLDAPVRGEGTPSNPGCYLEFEGGEKAPLYIPSAENAGFKLTGAFKVPSNGTVEMTADFDARKSVVKAATSGMYILKPAVRLIANNEAGQITGSVSGLPTDGSKITIYAYEDGTYSSSEADDPEAEATRFPNAVTNDKVGKEGGYHLSYLAPVTYDLVVARSLDGTFREVVTTIEDVAVESKQTTSQDVELSY